MTVLYDTFCLTNVYGIMQRVSEQHSNLRSWRVKSTPPPAKKGADSGIWMIHAFIYSTALKEVLDPGTWILMSRRDLWAFWAFWPLQLQNGDKILSVLLLGHELWGWANMNDSGWPLQLVLQMGVGGLMMAEKQDTRFWFPQVWLWLENSLGMSSSEGCKGTAFLGYLIF